MIVVILKNRTFEAKRISKDTQYAKLNFSKFECHVLNVIKNILDFKVQKKFRKKLKRKFTKVHKRRLIPKANI